MVTKKITTEDLPFTQFKLLGIEKKDVLSLPESTLNALTSGRRTSLLQFKDFKLNALSEPTTLNAKLSIAISEDGKPYLKMHPVNIEPKNDFGLTNDEISYLKKEPLNLLPKMVLDKKGNLIDSFVSLDKTTNEYIAIKRDSINAPDKINEIQLTAKQKTDFKNGKPIQLGTKNFQLDVNSDSSVSEQNLKSVQFKSGKYSTNNALMDIALITTGAGALVLLEHVAKMLLRNRDLTDHLLAHGTKTVNNQANALLKVLTKNQEPINKILNDAIQEIKTNPNMRPTEANEMLLKNLSNQIKSQNLNEVSSDQKIITAGNESTSIIVQQTGFTKREGFKKVEPSEKKADAIEIEMGNKITTSDPNTAPDTNALKEGKEEGFNEIDPMESVERYYAENSEELGRYYSEPGDKRRDWAGEGISFDQIGTAQDHEDFFDNMNQKYDQRKETLKTANELNQKENLKVKLNNLRDSYESKGYFTDEEAAKNAVLTEQFNNMGKENKIAADDQTIPKIGQTENENKEAQHEITKLSIKDNKETNTQEITKPTEKVTSSFLKR